MLEAFITTLLACLTAMELEQTTDPTHLKLLLLKEVHWIVHNILLGWKVVSKWFFIGLTPPKVKYCIEIKVVGTIYKSQYYSYVLHPRLHSTSKWFKF